MKFQPSAIAATNMSGKSGGTVATITNVFRRKSNPRQPNTSKQSYSKAIFASISSSWEGLTEDQQDSFIAAAPNFVFYKNGEAYTLKGNTLYQKLNNNLVRAGQPMINVAPLPEAFPGIQILSNEFYTDQNDNSVVIRLNLAPGADSTGFTIIGLATAEMPSGRRYMKKSIKEIGILEISGTEIDYKNKWAEEFGIPRCYPIGDPPIYQDGLRVEAGFYLINNTTGQANKIQTAQTVTRTILFA